MPEKTTFHEDYARQDEVTSGSERSFGLVFAAVFAVIALWPLIDGGAARLWSLAVAGGLLLVAVVAPRLLAPLNRLWFRFGLLLNRVVNPLILGMLFFTTITPIAVIMRLAGKDPLRRRFDGGAKSYWIERRPPGPEPETMRLQF